MEQWYRGTAVTRTAVIGTVVIGTVVIGTRRLCTGDFNISDHESGCFCTEEHKIRFFDQETDMTLDQWRNSVAYYLLCRIHFEPTRWVWSKDMTDKEKAAHPEYKTTGGYLKE